MNENSKSILSFGGGVDSTCLLAMRMNRAKASAFLGFEITEEHLPSFNEVVFADPGAEWNETYEHIENIAEICMESGIKFHKTFKTDAEGNQVKIQDWLMKNGTVPVMAGGPHVCSLKFKGEVMKKWGQERFGSQSINWLIGIEASETKRQSRFTPPKGEKNSFSYPLIALGMDRQKCVDMLIHLDWKVPHKSACVFCPFAQKHEVKDLLENNPEGWELTKRIERRFQETSFIKHQAWIDAGSPNISKQPGKVRAPRGMWKSDAWENGKRLFCRLGISCKEIENNSKETLVTVDR